MHRSPEKRLLCHACSAERAYPTVCDKCGGSRLLPVGYGIQRIEGVLETLFPETPLYRIDSDNRQKHKGIAKGMTEVPGIILGTELVNGLYRGDIGLVGVVLLETEFTVPEYDIEERVYDNIVSNMKRGAEVVIQTYLPNAPIVTHLTEGNFRSFFQYVLTERRAFGYPPYGEMAYIWIRDSSLSRLTDITAKLANKIELLHPDANIRIDRSVPIRRADEYLQKIAIRAPEVTPILDSIRYEIFHNRQVSVEWR